jgi:hypothetical protein
VSLELTRLEPRLGSGGPTGQSLRVSEEQYEVFVSTGRGVECIVVARPVPRLTWRWDGGTPRRWWNSLRRTDGWEVYVARADRGNRWDREVVPSRDEAISRADALAESLRQGP